MTADFTWRPGDDNEACNMLEGLKENVKKRQYEEAWSLKLERDSSDQLLNQHLGIDMSGSWNLLRNPSGLSCSRYFFRRFHAAVLKLEQQHFYKMAIVTNTNNKKDVLFYFCAFKTTLRLNYWS